MKQRRYCGEFLSIDGHVWRCELWQDNENGKVYCEEKLVFCNNLQVGHFSYDTVRGDELSFDINPLELEWSRVDKYEPIQGSTATLRVVSPSDRTFEDLYSEKIGSVRLDVYRDDALYWSGMMDTEFYEEPYELYDNYIVSLTFSDFGILNRIKYDLDGLQTIDSIIDESLAKSGINYVDIDSALVSTTLENGETSILGETLSVRSDNFFDEENEASSYYDVLKGILQPLGLRIIQRYGMIKIYDLNGLYDNGTIKEIKWDGATQNLGVDKVANNIIVTYSPYSSSIITPDFEYLGKYDASHYSEQEWGGSADGYGLYYSFYADYEIVNPTTSPYIYDFGLLDFTIYLYNKAKGLDNINSNLRYFHTMPLSGGEEKEGVGYAFRIERPSILSTPTWTPLLKSGINKPNFNENVFKSNPVFIPKLSESDKQNYWIRVKQDILLDARYNPYSSSDEFNCNDNDDIVKDNVNWAFIPVKIQIYDSNGNVIAHYKNKDIAQNSVEVGTIVSSAGTWVSGADNGGDCWLEYYGTNNINEEEKESEDDKVDRDCAIRGWKTNRQCIGRQDGANGRYKGLFKSLINVEDGQYIPYPPYSGNLVVEVFSGVYFYKYAEETNWAITTIADEKDVLNKLRWCLYGVPTVEVLNNNLVFDSTELDDVEYKAYLNKYAKEDISLETIYGTSESACPTAKGAMIKTSTGLQLQKLKRGGVIDHPENLLIGTMYSQYSSRKTTLSGEAVIDGGLHKYTEQNQNDKYLMLMSDIQNVRMGTTQAEYCEFKPDEYEKL